MSEREPMDLVRFHRNETVTIRGRIARLDGTPADLTGLTGNAVRWSIAKKRGGPPLATVNLDEIEVLDAVGGEVEIQFRAPVPADADPDPFKPGLFWHEAEATTDEGTSTQFWGPVFIDKSMHAGG